MASDAYPGKTSSHWPSSVVISLRTLIRCIKFASLFAIAVVLARSLFLESTGTPIRWPSSENFGEQAADDALQSRWSYQGAQGGAAALKGPAASQDRDASHRLLGEASSASASSANKHSSSGHAGCGGHGSMIDKTLQGTLSFLFFCFVVCCLLEHWNLLVPWEWRFPISVIMYIGGIAVGTLVLQVFSSDDHKETGFDALISGLQGAARIDPHALLYIVLPPLLYESASSMWWHVLRKVLPSAIILAGPGVLLNTLLTGIFVKLVFRVHGEQPSWEASWLLSTILSATDPVAVVAALAALGAPKKLASLLEGESLLNDGTAVVAAYVFRDWVADESADKYCSGSPPNGWCVLLFFCRVGLGGVCVGLIIGGILYFWVNWARHRHYPVLEIGIILSAVYGAFFVAEAMHMSGVLAVVVLGFVMTSAVQTRMSREGHHAHHLILSQIGYACNQVAFFSAGLITALFMEVRDSACDHTAFLMRPWLELAGLYVAIHITRAVVVISFSPALRRMGYGISWKEGALLVYGGLRGAVGLVMALIIEHNQHIDPNVAQMIAFHTSGIVLLTLLINGSTVDEVYRKLNIYHQNAFRTEHLQRVFAKFELQCQKGGIRKLARDWFFFDCQFDSILRCVPNFECIKFDIGGMALPDMIIGVTRCLRLLETDANQHKQSMIMERASMFEKEFNSQWVQTKGLATQNFIELISCSSDMHNRTDWVYRVEKVLNSKLKYTSDTGHEQPGMYVSARPLRVLIGPDDDPSLPSFEITVPCMENTQIIVGLIADYSEPRHPVPTPTNQVLGELSNSMGFNITTGEARCFGPEGKEVFGPEHMGKNSTALSNQRQSGVQRQSGYQRQTSRMTVQSNRQSLRKSGMCPVGSSRGFTRVTVSLFQDENANMEWGAYFKTNQGGHQAPQMCRFGEFDGDFFPAIEFRCEPPPPAENPQCLDTAEHHHHKSDHHIQFRDEEEELLPTTRVEGSIISGTTVYSAVSARNSELKNAWTSDHGDTLALEEAATLHKMSAVVPSGTTGSSKDVKSNDRKSNDRRTTDGMNNKSSKQSTGMSLAGRMKLSVAGILMKPVGVLRQSAQPQGAIEEEPVAAPKKDSSLAEVTLSFEPLFVHDSESICELIHLLFNTVMQQYTHMHENGILGTQALAWLRASVGEAMDCAGKEVNALRAMGFKTAKRHSVAARQSFAHRPSIGAGARTSEPAGAGGRKSMTQYGSEDGEKNFTFRNSIGAAAHVCGVLSQIRDASEGCSKQQLVGLFEPLVVEYLALERQLGKRDVFDYCPHRLPRLRQLGYRFTRSKVEALWAFIEAHNHVIKEAPNIDRFPDLVKVINNIVDECKQDLSRIEEIRPRRFYFCKHDLALRVILNRRLEKLRGLMDGGWITAKDGQGLVDSLWERIVESDQFVPQLQTTATLATRNSTVDGHREDVDEPNAWDKFDFDWDSENIAIHTELQEASVRLSCGVFEAARRSGCHVSPSLQPPAYDSQRQSSVRAQSIIEPITEEMPTLLAG